MSRQPPQNSQDRALKAAVSLDTVAAGLQYGVAPALILAALVITVGTSDRPLGLLWLTAGAGAVGASIVSTLCKGFAALLCVNSDHALTSARLESLLQQIAGGGGMSGSAGLKARLLAEIRQATRAGHWNEAEALVGAFAVENPGDPDAARAAEELAGSRRAAGEDLVAKIAAAREVNDADRVVELRDAAKPLLDAETLRALDRDLAKWFMAQIHRRLRTGSVRPDVVELASKVSATLDETPEGASLRASLPTLRRAAGLCARCGRPYKGIADACPSCTTAAISAQDNAPPTAAPEPEDDPETDDMAEPLFREPDDGTPDPFHRV